MRDELPCRLRGSGRHGRRGLLEEWSCCASAQRENAEGKPAARLIGHVGLCLGHAQTMTRSNARCPALFILPRCRCARRSRIASTSHFSRESVRTHSSGRIERSGRLFRLAKRCATKTDGSRFSSTAVRFSFNPQAFAAPVVRYRVDLLLPPSRTPVIQSTTGVAT